MENTLSRLDSYNVLGQDEMMDINGGKKIKWKVIGGVWTFAYGVGYATGQFVGNVWNAIFR